MSQNSSGTGPKSIISGLIGLAFIALIFYLGGGDLLGTGDQSQGSAPEVTARSEPANVDTPTEPAAQSAPADVDIPTEGPVSGLPVVLWGELPPEAQETIQLIDKGGPFPYDKDGSTFQNREDILPDKPNGYYSEYTVITPGSGDRGARRIVGGDDDELYYTDDHYDSFREVVR